ncbi:phosphatases II [Wallemia mellicola]|uniref:phosphatidylinositol-3,4,5-trisphosphate 3-phosphatase n=1 Tax=Wallemia mellicola TaxID=1708541 RepID=A0A4T0MDR5_9BASI|nr:phosphatases II [Wallemia mellicola]
MANITRYIQRIVSGPKQRFKDPETDTDLDLSYISDNIIIMGYPTPANNYQAVYRNNQVHVRKLLESRHGRNWRIYNLCPCHENSYDPSYFYNQVSRYPFPDHHAPPLPLIKVAVRDMKSYLSENKDNVVVIHCKAGKGRSGTMACCLLLLLGELPPPSRHVSKKSRSDVPQPEITPPNLDHLDPKREASTVQRLVSPHVVPSPASSTSHLTTTEDLPPALQRAQDVIQLHTHRRMKTKQDSEVSKWRTGVSIPSQRRFIEYYARVLAREIPQNNHTVNVTKITVRLTENFGMIGKTIFGLANTRMGLHFAKYNDDYVKALEDGAKDNSFKVVDDKWDKQKMVTRFAETDEYTVEECNDGIKILTFNPNVTLTSSRECRLRLVFGQFSVGWIWFIPGFHIFPLVLTNEQIDFTKGSVVGISLVDVKLELT